MFNATINKQFKSKFQGLAGIVDMGSFVVLRRIFDKQTSHGYLLSAKLTNELFILTRKEFDIFSTKFKIELEQVQNIPRLPITREKNVKVVQIPGYFEGRLSDIQVTAHGYISYMDNLYTSQLGAYTKLIIRTMNFTHLDVVHKLSTQTQSAPAVLAFYTQNTVFYERCLRTKDPNAEEFEVWLTGLLHYLNAQISKKHLEDLASKRSGGARQMRNYLTKWAAQHNASKPCTVTTQAAPAPTQIQATSTKPADVVPTPKVDTKYAYYATQIARALDYVIAEVSAYMCAQGKPLKYPVTAEKIQPFETITNNKVNLHRGLHVMNPQALRGMSIVSMTITLDNLKVYSGAELLTVPVSILVKSDNSVDELWLCTQREKEKIIQLGTILKAYKNKDATSLCTGLYDMYTKLNKDNITNPPVPKKLAVTAVPAINNFRMQKFLNTCGVFFNTARETYLEEAKDSNRRTYLSNWDVQKSSIKNQKIEDMEALFKHIHSFIDDLWNTYRKEISFETGANDHLVAYLMKLIKEIEDTTNSVQRRTLERLDDASVDSKIFIFFDDYGDATQYEENFITGVFNEFATVLHELKQDYTSNEEYYRKLFREPQQPINLNKAADNTLKDIAHLFHL